jgi:hypothetical protein
MDQWFGEHNINPIWWPAHSPDLSPVEAMWHLLRTYTYDEEVNSFEEFAEKLKAYWWSIPQKIVDNLVDSFWNRC